MRRREADTTFCIQSTIRRNVDEDGETKTRGPGEIGAMAATDGMKTTRSRRTTRACTTMRL